MVVECKLFNKSQEHVELNVLMNHGDFEPLHVVKALLAHCILHGPGQILAAEVVVYCRRKSLGKWSTQILFK